MTPQLVTPEQELTGQVLRPMAWGCIIHMLIMGPVTAARGTGIIPDHGPETLHLMAWGLSIVIGVAVCGFQSTQPKTRFVSSVLNTVCLTALCAFVMYQIYTITITDLGPEPAMFEFMKGQLNCINIACLAIPVALLKHTSFRKIAHRD